LLRSIGESVSSVKAGDWSPPLSSDGVFPIVPEIVTEVLPVFAARRGM
jgi:hypothetical protein